MVALFTCIPWIIFSSAFGWRGLAGSVFGEVIALFLWTAVHEAVFRERLPPAHAL